MGDGDIFNDFVEIKNKLAELEAAAADCPALLPLIKQASDLLAQLKKRFTGAD